jgi:NAD binding domain of 6-phosphogluconate dehydrogenase
MTETGDGKGSKSEKLGYLGLGLMGIPMVRRLLNAGHELTVWNRSAGEAAVLVEAGAKLAPIRAASPNVNPRRCRGRASARTADQSCSADPRRPSIALTLERN